jgi:hypothetical protein
MEVNCRNHIVTINAIVDDFLSTKEELTPDDWSNLESKVAEAIRLKKPTADKQPEPPKQPDSNNVSTGVSFNFEVTIFIGLKFFL